MKGRKVWSILSAIWFLLWGLLAVSNFKFGLSGEIMGLLAIAVAVLWCFDK